MGELFEYLWGPTVSVRYSGSTQENYLHVPANKAKHYRNPSPIASILPLQVRLRVFLPKHLNTLSLENNNLKKHLVSPQEIHSRCYKTFDTTTESTDDPCVSQERRTRPWPETREMESTNTSPTCAE